MLQRLLQKTNLMQTKLSWVPGSIPKYSSFWFTLRRIIYLNSLRKNDLNQIFSLEKSFNIKIKNDLDEGMLPNSYILLILNCIGESPLAIKHSYMGCYPRWMREIFINEIAICSSCLAMGYHSNLFSLKNLISCPIHKIKLTYTCNHCNNYFKRKINGDTFKNPKSCSCGLLHYFSVDNARKPKISENELKALDPIALWLDNLSEYHKVDHRISFKSYRNLELRNNLNDLIFSYSQSLGVNYPEELVIKNQEVSFAKSVNITKANIRFSDDPYFINITSYFNKELLWGDIARIRSGEVYRSISRFFKRKFKININYWYHIFSKSSDPIEISRLIRDNKKAYIAFVYILWTSNTNRNYRWYSHEKNDYLIEGEPIIGHQVSRPPKCEEFHHFGQFLLGVWNSCAIMANDSIVNSVADWSRLEFTNIYFVETFYKYDGENIISKSIYLPRINADSILTSGYFNSLNSLESVRYTYEYLINKRCLTVKENKDIVVVDNLFEGKFIKSKNIYLTKYDSKVKVLIYWCKNKFYVKLFNNEIQSEASRIVDAIEIFKDYVSRFEVNLYESYSTVKIKRNSIGDDLPYLTNINSIKYKGGFWKNYAMLSLLAKMQYKKRY